MALFGIITGKYFSTYALSLIKPMEMPHFLVIAKVFQTPVEMLDCNFIRIPFLQAIQVQ